MIINLCARPAILGGHATFCYCSYYFCAYSPVRSSGHLEWTHRQCFATRPPFLLPASTSSGSLLQHGSCFSNYCTCSAESNKETAGKQNYHFLCTIVQRSQVTALYAENILVFNKKTLSVRGYRTTWPLWIILYLMWAFGIYFFGHSK